MLQEVVAPVVCGKASPRSALPSLIRALVCLYREAPGLYLPCCFLFILRPVTTVAPPYLLSFSYTRLRSHP